MLTSHIREELWRENPEMTPTRINGVRDKGVDAHQVDDREHNTNRSRKDP